MVRGKGRCLEWKEAVYNGKRICGIQGEERRLYGMKGEERRRCGMEGEERGLCGMENV